MRKAQELAVIFKITHPSYGIGKQTIEFIPIKVIEGVFDYENEVFTDKDNTIYHHLIDDPETYGFANRISIENIRKQYPHIPLPVVKALLLKNSRGYYYQLAQIVDDKVPVIIITSKQNPSKKTPLFDSTLLPYYLEYCPDILKNYLKAEENEQKEEKAIIQEAINEQTKLKEIEASTSENTQSIDINALYKELTSNVINQDEPIRKILVGIWKQYNDFSDNKSRNILINGSTGVGKTEIFRIIAEQIGIPTVIASAPQYSATGYIGRSVEDMLTALLEKANGNLDKAERGILIIDEIDKISQTKDTSSVNQRDVQENLLKMIEDGSYLVTYNGSQTTFETGRLMVIAMGSWSRIELEEEKVVGFEQKSKKRQYKDLTKEDFIKNGMIPELVGRFNIIVQMNELDYNSLLEILNRAKNSALNTQKEFFKKREIDLIVEEAAKKAIALKASNNNLGARSLDEIIETALSEASFEIATNPSAYEKLIITPDTIEDNKKYTLIRRKTN